MSADRFVWLVEGEPDCICALSHGLRAVTVTGGAGTWKREFSEALAGQDVVICYDADAAGAKGAGTVAEALAPLAASVRVVEWPECMMNPKGKLPKDNGQDLTDWFMVHGKTVDELLALAEAAEVIEAPAPPDEPDEPDEEQQRRDLCLAADAMTRFREWSDFDQKTAYRPLLLVHDIMRRQRTLCERKTKRYFMWDGRFWEPCNTEALKRLFIAKMGIIASPNRLSEALDLLTAETALPEGEEMDLRPELLCLLDGMLDLDTGELLDHDPAYRCTFLFPYHWRPNDPPDCPWFKRTLLEALANPEVIDEVLEFIAYCLWYGQQYKKALLMVGPKDCGKSLVQEVIRQLLGPDKCSAVNMADLEDQFQRVALHRKLANICGETSANFFSSDNFKRLTGGDPVQAAYKGVDTFTFNTQAKLIFAANEFPRVKDQTTAFYDRMLAVEFPRQFRLGEPGTDPHRINKIVPDELEGIFHLAVAKLYHLRRRGAFHQSRASYNFLNQYRLENNHVARFVEEVCITEPVDGAPPEGTKTAVYGAYKSWCEDNGVKPKGSPMFWKTVVQAYPHVRVKDHGPKMPNGTRPAWVVGMHLRENQQQAA